MPGWRINRQGEGEQVLQLAATAICVVLGWQRAAFLRWPLAIIVAATIAGCALVIASHHAGAGPDLDGKLLRVALSLIAFPAGGYGLARGLRAAIDRRAQK